MKAEIETSVSIAGRWMAMVSSLDFGILYLTKKEEDQKGYQLGYLFTKKHNNRQ